MNLLSLLVVNITRTYMELQYQREGTSEGRIFTIWLTGLSGAGKSTIANLTEKFLLDSGICTFILDGDHVRTGLCADLDFSREGRKENIRRVSEVAKLFNQAGIVVITAFISPFVADREQAKSIIGVDRFLEVFVDAPLECCMQRDVKGLYEKARIGLISSFTGVSDVYEPPQSPDIRLFTEKEAPEKSVNKLILKLRENKMIP